MLRMPVREPGRWAILMGGRGRVLVEAVQFGVGFEVGIVRARVCERMASCCGFVLRAHVPETKIPNVQVPRSVQALFHV